MNIINEKLFKYLKHLKYCLPFSETYSIKEILTKTMLGERHSN